MLCHDCKNSIVVFTQAGAPVQCRGEIGYTLRGLCTYSKLVLPNDKLCGSVGVNISRAVIFPAVDQSVGDTALCRNRQICP